TLNPSINICLVDYELLRIGSCMWDFSNAEIWDGEIISPSQMNSTLDYEGLSKLLDFIETNGVQGGLLTPWKSLMNPDHNESSQKRDIFHSVCLKNLYTLKHEMR